MWLLGRIRISYEDLIEVAINNFNTFVEREGVYKHKHLLLLKNCINIIDQGKVYPSQILEKIKELILVNPNEYFKYFIELEYLSSISSMNSITTRSLWLEIFKDPNWVRDFIFDKKQDNAVNIKGVRNFWRLYESNNYVAIPFSGNTSVEERIKKELEEEVKLLDKCEILNQEYIKLKRASERKEIDYLKFSNERDRLITEISSIDLDVKRVYSVKEFIQSLKM